VLCEANAIEQPYSVLVEENQTARLTVLGELAAAVRGSNELFLAMVFLDPDVGSLTSVQIAALAASIGAAEDRKRSGNEG
jgi:superfamily II RNA helicase